MSTENRIPVSQLPLRQVPSVRALLVNDNARDQLSAVAAKHMNPERMMRVVANAIRTTPKLQDCEPMSFLGALMQCAALGLEPNTILGHAYLIPFENSRKRIGPDGKPVKGADGRDIWDKIPEVQLIVGYKGLIDLARRSGHITSIAANIHYSDDELWEYEEGTEATLRHRPGPQEGKKLHAYAIAKFKDGGHAYVVLPWKVVMRVRDGSQNWQSAVRNGKTNKNPWFTHEDAMAMKSAVRALSKYLPLSVEFMDAMSVDEQRADYRAFAMNPDAGLTIEGEAEEGHDPETGEVRDEQPKQVENMRTLNDATQERQREPAPAARQRRQEKAREDATPYAQNPAAEDLIAKEAARVAAARAQAQAQAEAPQRNEGPSHEAALRGLADRISDDLLDCASENSVDQVLELWAEHLGQIEREAPTLHAEIQEAIAQTRARVGGGQASMRI
ncbi:hypothetical protein EYE35_01300 [Cereibacter sphaeroides]|nr:hypothetical protein EYE35_01300 [Cereibacter sphaeroides]